MVKLLKHRFFRNFSFCSFFSCSKKFSFIPSQKTLFFFLSQSLAFWTGKVGLSQKTLGAAFLAKNHSFFDPKRKFFE